MSRRVYRYVVPVDDEWHMLTLHGPIVHVDSRHPGDLEVWALFDEGAAPALREFRVFGTGHDLPDDADQHVGSVIVANGALVWHLFERAA